MFLFFQKTHIHIYLRRIVVEDWISGQDKQEAIEILHEWEELLLNNLNDFDYSWARTSSQRLHDHSLVYIPKDKRQGECCLSVYWGI